MAVSGACRRPGVPGAPPTTVGLGRPEKWRGVPESAFGFQVLIPRLPLPRTSAPARCARRSKVCCGGHYTSQRRRAADTPRYISGIPADLGTLPPPRSAAPETRRWFTVLRASDTPPARRSTLLPRVMAALRITGSRVTRSGLSSSQPCPPCLHKWVADGAHSDVLFMERLSVLAVTSTAGV
jgi:hypothetical protein